MSNRERDDDVAREIRAHLELEADERVADGATPDEARLAARRAFGNVTRIREDARAVWTRRWIEQSRQDVRYALRTLARTPGFTAITVCTLALGIGATSAIFSVVHAVLLRPLPFDRSDRMVRVFESVADANGAPRRVSPLVAADVATLRSHASTLSHVGVQIPTVRTITSREEPVRLIGVRLSPDLLTMTGSQPLIGRVFGSHEDAPGAEAVVVLSHATWQRYFGADPGLVGRTIGLDGRTHTVVGIMGPDFAFPSAEDEFWMPLTTSGPMMRQRLPITARVKDGVSLDAARAEIGALVPKLRGDSRSAGTGAPALFEVVPLLDLVVTPVKPALQMLSAAGVLVLMIACTNVMHLLLVRTAARQRELAVRLALGAGRGRLIRQALVESLLLAFAGGLGGVALAFGAVALLHRLGTTLPRRDLGFALNIPRLDEIGIDPTVLAFTLVTAALTGLVFGTMPALASSRSLAMRALRPGTSPLSGFSLFRRQRLQGLLVIAEIAMALMLFAGGGLLVRSFVRVVGVNPGYEPRNVLTFQVSLPPSSQGPPASTDEKLRALADDLVRRVQVIPGVRAVGYAESLPMTRVSIRFAPLRTTRDAMRPDGPPSMPRSFTPDNPDTRLVSLGFLEAMGIRAIAGRAFDDDDRFGRPRVMLINRALARSGLLGEHPIGTRVYALGREPWEVVGIVDDVRQASLTEPASPQTFFDFRQVDPSEPLVGIGLYFGIRTDGDPMTIAADVRTIVRQLDPQLMIENVAPMGALVANSVARPRLYAVLLGIFAAIAVALAATGIFGVMSYSVTRRTSEIGVRAALGATRGQILGLVLGESLVLTGAGLAVGLLAAGAVTRFLDQWLFGLTPLDPATFVAVTITFGSIATLAALIPARRATRVDPLSALRAE